MLQQARPAAVVVSARALGAPDDAVIKDMSLCEDYKHDDNAGE